MNFTRWTFFFLSLSLSGCGWYPLPGKIPDVPPPDADVFSIIAHKGLHEKAPENTIASIKAAIDAGIARAEIDIRMTNDSVPVVIHDGSIEKATGHNDLVRDISLAHLRTLPATYGKGDEWADERVPALADVLAVANGKIQLVLHIKSAAAEKEIAQVIHQSGVPLSDVTIMSDDFQVLGLFRRHLPDIPTAHLASKVPSPVIGDTDAVKRTLRFGSTTLSLSYQAASRHLIDTAHKAGLRAIVWTADLETESRAILDEHADGVITNFPVEWREWAAGLRPIIR